MLRFSFKETPFVIKNAKDADAQAIGTELTRISDQNGGLLTPDNAWEAARNRRNPLHRHVEWNVEIAAKAYQLDQCRELIRIIRVVDTDRDDKKRRAFVSINDGGRAYRSTGEVLDSRDLQLLVLEQAEKDLKAWEARYGDLLEICAMVRQARLRLAEIRDTQQAEVRPQ